jgi:hypothetical protein
MSRHPLLILVGLTSLAFGASRLGATNQPPAHRAFTSPEDAVQALIEAVKAGKLEALSELFGPDGKDLIESSDPVTARRNRQVFRIAAAEKWEIVDSAADRKTLVIGHEEWPFPVPLTKAANVWRFDTAAGKEEIIARRIGRNELSTIDTCRAYVTAQQRYAQEGRDGRPAGIYATKFRSDTGRNNGLYWPTARNQKPSPLGDLLAAAGAEMKEPRGEARQPLNGYYFRILTEQGRDARGGRKNYIVNNAMTGGFALVAWPAQYEVTGVMTFIVNHDGIVYEKDLGLETTKVVEKLLAYNPDSSWRPVKAM